MPRRVPHPIAYFVLFAIQVGCAQDIFWTGLPIYRKLLHGQHDATTEEILRLVTVIVLMQAAYWLAYGLRYRLQFRRHPFLGHTLNCFGDLSFLFPTTLAAVALFDSEIELKKDWWRMLTLAAGLFAMFCYKYQLQWLGNAWLDGKDEPVSAGTA